MGEVRRGTGGWVDEGVWGWRVERSRWRVKGGRGAGGGWMELWASVEGGVGHGCEWRVGGVRGVGGGC